MNLFEDGEDGDITGVGDKLLCNITASDGNWNTADSTATTFDVWTCNRGAGEYIDIVTLNDGARNMWTDGKYSTSRYRMAGSARQLWITPNNRIDIDFDGVQFQCTGDDECIQVSTIGANSELNWDNCYIEGNGTTSGENCLELNDSDLTSHLVNCIIVQKGSQPAVITYDVTLVRLINCTITGSVATGVNVTSGTVDLINCAIFNTTNDYEGAFNTHDHVASDDFNDGTNRVDISPSGDGGEATSWAKVFTDYANGDYRIKDTGSYIYRTGLDPNSDSDIPSTDIAGNARPTGANPVSIGAFEYVAASSSSSSLSSESSSSLSSSSQSSESISSSSSLSSSSLSSSSLSSSSSSLSSSSSGLSSSSLSSSSSSSQSLQFERMFVSFEGRKPRIIPIGRKPEVGFS